MTLQDEIATAKSQSHWSARQRNHLRRLQRQGARIAYWCSDAHGRPANHRLDPMQARAWTARPGLVQVVAGPLELCSGQALHATDEPHRWAGVRVWVVGLVGAIEPSDGKFAALRREIVGEILPEEAMSDSVGARLGRKDLARAYLAGAELTRADLTGANLEGACLAGADLTGANLEGACLAGADLTGANLEVAYLAGADLTGANIEGWERNEMTGYAQRKP